MIFAAAAAWLFFGFGGSVEQQAGASGGSSVTVRQQFIVRVQRGPRPNAPAGASLLQWREARGPRCVPVARIAGATLQGQNSVDLILRDHSRVRARLERRCPALDYYYGFYLNATEDGQICADRDFIRSRVGGQCQIEQFLSLAPVRR
jgi:hypothetical protein